MDPSLETRLERPYDAAAIYEVVAAAFGRIDEARLVDKLRSNGFARVSAVAVAHGKIVAHVLFSELRIEGPQSERSALALAPLAVLPKFQNLGIGSALARFGLEECRRARHRLVFVLGHADYYPRFGFSAERARGFECEYAGDHFMALELAPGVLEGARGRIVYPAPFRS
ncbi:MAG TPA: N-acetyltransferase [Pirellulales bacterium]|nr:N-acetyltransferase [Pirellulales bacterium]